jgi:hypothetical protein
LRTQLSQKFLAAIESDFAIHGAEIISKMRQSHPERYAELCQKLIQTTEPPSNTGDMSGAKSADDLGRMLLESIGADPEKITDSMIARAIRANDRFLEDLEKIAGIKKDAERKDRKHGNGIVVDEAAAMMKHLGY